jgi:mono/diheme cytochrome c family protein
VTAASLRPVSSSQRFQRPLRPQCLSATPADGTALSGSARAIALFAGATIALALGCSDTVGDVLDGGSSGDATFTSVYADFKSCAECHAPGAQGNTAGTEATQDWSSSAKAYSSLKGKASGLVGNFAGCNGVSFIGSSADDSLLAASLDSDIRAKFMASSSCTGDDVADQTLHQSVSSSAVKNLEDWINAGAPNN